MSLYKRIWIEVDPAHADHRREQMAEVHAAIAAAPYPAKGRRRNRLAGSPHWDPLWPRCLREATDELGARFLTDYVPVNSRVMFRSAELLDRVMARAEQLWAERLEQRRPKSRLLQDDFMVAIRKTPLPKAR